MEILKSTHILLRPAEDHKHIKFYDIFILHIVKKFRNKTITFQAENHKIDRKS